MYHSEFIHVNIHTVKTQGYFKLFLRLYPKHNAYLHTWSQKLNVGDYKPVQNNINLQYIHKNFSSFHEEKRLICLQAENWSICSDAVMSCESQELLDGFIFPLVCLQLLPPVQPDAPSVTLLIWDQRQSRSTTGKAQILIQTLMCTEL